MIRRHMTCINHLLKGIRVFLHIIAHAKKSGFCIIISQNIQYFWGDFRMGAIIEREVDYFGSNLHFPKELRKKMMKYFRRLKLHMRTKIKPSPKKTDKHT